MKKFFASAAFIIAFVAYAFYQHLGGGTEVATADAPAAPDTQTTQSAPAADTSSPAPVTTTPTPVATPAPSTPAAGQYTDGTYTGSVGDTIYGNIQVQATVSGGKLTDVTFLQYPNDRGESMEVSSHSMPILKSEAIQAQSSKVSTVSGATDTSAAFRESLASALSQAS